MSKIDEIRKSIERLYRTSPRIHVSINTVRPKITVSSAPAVIKGGYPNLLRVEECSLGFTRCHTIQYSDILIGRVKILELDNIKEQ